MAIIGISGKIGSGKDTVGKIIQYLAEYKDSGYLDFSNFKDCYLDNSINSNSDWKIVKFADKLKDIVCLLIGCTRKQLEDEGFKNTELGEEWDNDYDDVYHTNLKYEKLTPRKLLQLVGTDCGRNIIHPNIWINATMREYVDKGYFDNEEAWADDGGYYNKKVWVECLPDWIITDVRFPNEVKAIEDRGGIIIRVERDREVPLEECHISKDSPLIHPSEKALDNHTFKHTITNNETIDNLIDNVKFILEIEGII